MKRENVIAVFGLGIFGREVCKVLSQKGATVIAVDKDQQLVDRVKNIVTQALLLDSTDEDALRSAGLQDIDIAVVAIRVSIDASVLTTILLKNLGVTKIIARAVSAIHAQVLKQVGATQVINIEVEQGRRLANRIITPDVMDMISISDDQSVAELRVPDGFVGKSLHQLGMRKKYNVNIVSIKRTKLEIDSVGNPVRKDVIFSPRPMDTLHINDILVVLGTEDDINKLKETAK